MEKITQFPEFVDISLDVQDELEDYVNGFPPYSDFNFASLHSWNIENDMGVAWLNGNAVFRFNDYMTGESFYSFIGGQEIGKTASDLLDAAKVGEYMSELRLIPQMCAEKLAGCPGFEIIEDPDNHDYILSISALSALAGSRQLHTRRSVNQFSKEWGEESNFCEIDLQSTETVGRMLDIFNHREQAKADNDEANELEALRRVLASPEVFNLKSFGVEVAGELQAFIICELLEDKQVMGHFWRANTEYKGLYQYLLNFTAKALEEIGYTDLNVEQDLGIPGLRESKQYLRPVSFLKKYTVKMSG